MLAIQKRFYKGAASKMSVKDKTRSKAAWQERVRFQMEGGAMVTGERLDRIQCSC